MPEPWSPDSWRSKPIEQRIAYPDPDALQAVLAELAKLPPLVTSWEVEALKQQLAEAARGERFLLQGGDCSESFDDCQAAIIASNLKVLLKMSFVLIYGCRKRVIRVGRFAGQYAKPRSAETETRDGVTLPSYRGPLINRPGLHGRGAHPAAGLSPGRLSPLGADDQLHSRAGRRRFCRPAPSRVLERRFRPPRGGGRRLSPDHRLDQRGDPLHGGRGRPAAGRIDPRRFLHQPRGPAPGVRTGPDAAGPPPARQMVQPLHPFSLDRRPHATVGRRPRRILPRHCQSRSG